MELKNVAISFDCTVVVFESQALLRDSLGWTEEDTNMGMRTLKIDASLETDVEASVPALARVSGTMESKDGTASKLSFYTSLTVGPRKNGTRERSVRFDGFVCFDARLDVDPCCRALVEQLVRCLIKLPVLRAAEQRSLVAFDRVLAPISSGTAVNPERKRAK